MSFAAPFHSGSGFVDLRYYQILRNISPQNDCLVHPGLERITVPRKYLLMVLLQIIFDFCRSRRVRTSEKRKTRKSYHSCYITYLRLRLTIGRAGLRVSIMLGMNEIGNSTFRVEINDQVRSLERSAQRTLSKQSLNCE
nr:hypothetical protein Iba_chr04cCG5450 [Ipomoea batatas]